MSQTPKDMSYEERKVRLNNTQQTILLSNLKKFDIFWKFIYFRGMG